MNLRRSAAKRYRSLTTIALLLSGSLLPLAPALAQSSPPPGTLIENQATATFTDAADNTIGNIVSDKVSVTVAEVAGISANNSGISGTVYRNNIVFFDFLIRNEGNDPTQLFVPAAPSIATIGGVALPAENIGQLQVIEYNNVTTTTPVTTGNLVDTTTGSATGALTGVPNNGSVPAGGYIKVRVPVTVPFSAATGAEISITLGNTAGQAADTNTPYVLGANGTGGANDLYTQDNTGTDNGDTSGNPINGDTDNRRQEASATQTAPVVLPPDITIKGTAWDDGNGTGTSTFTNIKDPTEVGANVTPPINAILVDSLGKVAAIAPVGTDGTYTLTTPGVQNGLYVILSTETPLVGQPAPTPDLPTGWTNTTPLSYAALPFNVGIANVTGKDFGIELLPETLIVNTVSQPNSPGATKYVVPTLNAKDAEDDPLGTLGTIKTFKIVTLPDAETQGILYYKNAAGVDVPVVAGDTITDYDPAKLTFDPVDGPVSMSFTYTAIDAAGKEDPTPAAATMTFGATPIIISGTVYNDKDNSAAGTFTNIQTNGEVGTDAVFGTTTSPAYAILTDGGGIVLQSVLVGTDGSYSFLPISAGSTVKVGINRASVNPGERLARPLLPTGWVGTSPIQSSIVTGFLPVTQDFGIRQKAKLVLVKRITRINEQTINPNDNTDLTVSTPDTFNTGVGNWPANYLVGKLDAGIVKPGDTIEYTVYFLNNQGADATGVKICDPIKGSQDFLPNSIKLNLAGASSDTALTDADDSADRANSYIGGTLPSGCNADASTVVGADNGGVAISLTGTATTNQPAQTGIPGATGVATPAESYGLFRFSTTVQGGSTVTNTVVN
jgi:uncharacterized repeat protein (TIGR01451 family)